MDLAGQLAVVTGGAIRVGRAIVEMLADRGADVGIHYGTSGDAAEEAAGYVRAAGGQAFLVRHDLADAAAAGRIVDDVAAASGRPPTLLVNSASGFPEDELRRNGLDEWDETMRVSLEAPVRLMAAFRDRLGDGRGAIVNVTDVRIERPYPRRVSYTVAKGALATATKTAAVALAPNIRVNAIAFGIINDPADAPDGYAERLAAGIPLGEPAGEASAAHAVGFLLENDFVTGVVLPFDGGYSLVNPLRNRGPSQ